MEFYELHPHDPQQRFISKAVKIIKDGGVIIYPTDTVYGIGCDIFNKAALERIFQIKNDTNTKLFSFVCSDLKDISKYARVSDYAYRMMKHLLPGPYTFILPASKTVPKTLWTKRKTVGIRVPNHKIALQLAAELGLHPTTYLAYETGSYWNGKATKAPRQVRLAAAALAHGIPPIE